MVIQVCSTFLTRHPEQFGLYTSKSEGPQDNALEVGKRRKWSTHLEEAPKHSDGAGSFGQAAGSSRRHVVNLRAQTRTLDSCSLAGFLRHTRFLLLLFCSSFLLIFNKVGTVVFDKMECAEL